MTPREATRELEWYFTSADAEQGLHSNYYASLMGENFMEEPDLDQVRKARMIHIKLAQLATHHQKALQWIYGGWVRGNKQPPSLLQACRLHNEALLLYINR